MVGTATLLSCVCSSYSVPYDARGSAHGIDCIFQQRHALHGFDLEQTHAQFQTTCWTVVHALSDADADQRQRCLEDLIQRYWPPVYAYLRRNGCSRDLAGETTQAFFSDCVLQRRLFEKAAEGKGRLSSLILHALKNYRIDVHRADVSRGMDLRVPFDVDRLETWLSTDDVDADQTFQRAWIAELFNDATRITQIYFEQTGKASHWQLFESHIICPLRTGGHSPGFAALAPQMGFPSPESARAAVQVVKRKLQEVFMASWSHSAGQLDGQNFDNVCDQWSRQK